MKATFHISKVMRNADGSIRKVGSMEWIMTISLAMELLKKKLGEFYVKKNNILETVLIVQTEKGPVLKTHLNNKMTTTLDFLPTYK